MNFTDLPATQQQALEDACAAPMPRCRGGFRGKSGRAHTVRACNALHRNGLLTWTDRHMSQLMPSPAGLRTYHASLADAGCGVPPPQQAVA
jgi:hypothetical protein